MRLAVWLSVCAVVGAGCVDLPGDGDALPVGTSNCAEAGVSNHPGGGRTVSLCGTTFRAFEDPSRLRLEDSGGLKDWRDLAFIATNVAVIVELSRNASLLDRAELQPLWSQEVPSTPFAGSPKPGDVVTLCTWGDHSTRLTLRAAGATVPVTFQELGACPDAGSLYDWLHFCGDTVDGRHRVLVDATRDGGAWWFPLAPGEEDTAADHQGLAFADHLRARGAYAAELPRGFPLRDNWFECQDLVVRANEHAYRPGTYTQAELDLYLGFVRDGGKLVLLSDHSPARRGADVLAEAFGLSPQNASEADARVVFEGEHPVGRGTQELTFLAGSCAAQVPSRSAVLARYADGVCEGRPAIVDFQFGAGEVLWLGDTNVLQSVPQPFSDEMLTWFGIG